nr:hypothetical protein [Ornithobacterium rhinotracheale]
MPKARIRYVMQHKDLNHKYSYDFEVYNEKSQNGSDSGGRNLHFDQSKVI